MKKKTFFGLLGIASALALTSFLMALRTAEKQAQAKIESSSREVAEVEDRTPRDVRFREHLATLYRESQSQGLESIEDSKPSDAVEPKHAEEKPYSARSRAELDEAGMTAFGLYSSRQGTRWHGLYLQAMRSGDMELTQQLHEMALSMFSASNPQNKVEPETLFESERTLLKDLRDREIPPNFATELDALSQGLGSLDDRIVHEKVQAETVEHREDLDDDEAPIAEVALLTESSPKAPVGGSEFDAVQARAPEGHDFDR